MTKRTFELSIGKHLRVCCALVGVLNSLNAVSAQAEGNEAADSGVSVTAEAWPEADAMFHRDPRWLGGDDAYSIDLGDGRIAWFFGDSFVAPTVEGDRKGYDDGSQQRRPANGRRSGTTRTSNATGAKKMASRVLHHE